MRRPMSPAKSSTGRPDGQGGRWAIAGEFSSRAVPTWEGKTAGSAQIPEVCPAHADRTASPKMAEGLCHNPAGPVAWRSAVLILGRGCRL